MKKILSIALFLSAAVHGQTTPIDPYLPDDNPDLAMALMTHSVLDIGKLFPQTRSAPFTAYVQAMQEPTAPDFAKLLGEVESLRMNKLVGASSGVSGSTSVVSRVAAPAVLGVGVEYGGILQQNNGAVTTLRANLLGVSRLALGQQQFPYCPEIAQDKCKPASRWLRRFSSSLSFEHVNTANGSTAAVLPAGSTTPTVAQLFTSENRMASWGARFDLTGSNNLDDPKYIAAWHAQIAKLRGAPETTALLTTIGELFQSAVTSDLYSDWRAQAFGALKTINDKAAFKKELAHQLDDLIRRMSAADPNFLASIANLNKAYNNYFQVRDDLIREAQTNKFSLEYTNQHPLNQPFFSNIRLIYSHQPTNSQNLITLNAGLTWYHQTPAGTDTGRLRDVQVAGQLDRRLGQIPKFGYAVFTLAGYFQYMQHDSILIIGPGNMTPGSGIILPGTAATLLGTSGAIGVVQAKLSIPVAGTMKIPFSVTWSNRTELINEKDVRAQVGLTLDFDSLFH